MVVSLVVAVVVVARGVAVALLSVDLICYGPCIGK